MLAQYPQLEEQANQLNWSYAQFLVCLCEHEAQQRYVRRIQRYLKDSHLPLGKTLSNFEFELCSELNPATVTTMATDSNWLTKGDNLLLFGPSGVGKTHLATAVGVSLIQQGCRVRFSSATALVQQLQRAKAELMLQEALLKLDRYELLIIDDIGYVKKSEAESSVLFELISHRYELKSLIITSNQPFSQWESVFGDSTMTVAAVDRLVHHSVILDIQSKSFRQRSAVERSKNQAQTGPDN